MRQEDIAAGLRLCRASGWNQLESDWSLFLALSPLGCRVAEAGGQVVGTVATLRYGNSFSWVAMMLVDPEYRRAGIGTRLLSEALELLRDEPTVRLDATSTGRELYRLFGFKDEYAISRLSRDGGRELSGPANATARPMLEQDVPQVLAYDHQVFGADRSTVLTSLFSRSRDYAWIAGASTEREGITGYCLGRAGFRYHQIGPVVARDERAAREVVSECLRNHASIRFVIDAPRRSPSWLGWLMEQGFVEERSFVRMYRGALPQTADSGAVFATVGPEFA